MASMCQITMELCHRYGITYGFFRFLSRKFYGLWGLQRLMGFCLQIAVHQVGGLPKLWDITGYGLSQAYRIIAD